MSEQEYRSTMNPSSRAGWRRPRSKSLVFPIVLIVTGVLLLLNNLGIVPWSVWLSLARLWPVVLILLGIDILVGRRHPWLGGGITALMLTVVLGVTVWTSIHDAAVGTAGGALQEKTAAVPISGASNGDVSINVGAGRLDVGALPADSPNLVVATAEVGPGVTLTPRTRLENGVQTATIDLRGGSRDWSFLRGSAGNGLTMNVGLNPRIPESLRFTVGAGQSTVDLSGVPVHALTVNNGAGQVEIHFPAGAGTTTADIQSGAGRLTLVIPPGVGAAIHNASGLVNVQVSDRFHAVSDGYRTADYDSAPNRVDITLHVGVGQVDVR